MLSAEHCLETSDPEQRQHMHVKMAWRQIFFSWTISVEEKKFPPNPAHVIRRLRFSAGCGFRALCVYFILCSPPSSFSRKRRRMRFSPFLARFSARAGGREACVFEGK